MLKTKPSRRILRNSHHFIQTKKIFARHKFFAAILLATAICIGALYVIQHRQEALPISKSGTIHEPQIGGQVEGSISNVYLSASPIEEGQSTAVSVIVTNTGDTNTTFQVKLTYSMGAISKEVYLSSSSTGTVIFDLMPTRADNGIGISLYANGVLQGERVVPLAVLYVDGAIIGAQMPSIIEEGQAGTASVTVKNTGNKNTIFRVQLNSISGIISSKDVYLTKDRSEVITLDITPKRTDNVISISLYRNGKLLSTETKSVIILYADLYANLTGTFVGWERGENDLPVSLVTISYDIGNNGTAAARNINYTLHIDPEVENSGTITYLAPNQSHEGVLQVRLKEGEHGLKLEAKTTFASANAENSFRITLPRFLWTITSEVAKLYITPNDPVIRKTLNEILSNKSWWDIRPNWMSIREWVGDKIKYTSDLALHGEDDYWQLPRETIELGKGDCEDSAILLCSLLRAEGYKPDEVYVVGGNSIDPATGEKTGHAWVVFKLFEVLGYTRWQYLEPTSGYGFLGTLADLAAYSLDSLARRILGENLFYETQVIFNDVEYKEWLR